MRSRNIKPGFFKNDTLAELDFAGRLLFIGLWGLADREGRLEDRPKKIKAEIFPYDDVNVDSFLGELAKRSFIIRYEAGGERYIQIVNFDKHQNPHPREAASTIPAPAGSCQGNTLDMPSRADSPSLTTESSFQGLLTTTTTTTVTTNQPGQVTKVTNDTKEKDEFAVVVDLLAKNICLVSNQVEADIIHDWLAQMPPGWVRQAINQAALGKARSIRYVDKILQAWALKYRHSEKPWEVEANGRNRKNGLSLIHRSDPTADEYERDRAKVGWGA
jgi:hypothetical protein